MAEKMNCPACGGIVEVDAGEQLVKCHFCGTEFHVNPSGEGADLTVASQPEPQKTELTEQSAAVLDDEVAQGAQNVVDEVLPGEGASVEGVTVFAMPPSTTPQPEAGEQGTVIDAFPAAPDLPKEPEVETGAAYEPPSAAPVEEAPFGLPDAAPAPEPFTLPNSDDVNLPGAEESYQQQTVASPGNEYSSPTVFSSGRSDQPLFEQPAEPSTPPSEPPVMPTAPYGQPPAPPAKKNNTWIIIAVAVVAVICLLCACIGGLSMLLPAIMTSSGF